MGATYDLVGIDLHESFVPNDLGKLAGTVRGGGLLILLTPALEVWAHSINYFHESILTPPYSKEDIKHNFIPWVINKLMESPGVAIYCNGKWIKKCNARCAEAHDGLIPFMDNLVFMTHDQERVFRRIVEIKSRMAIVLTADRGRGKSSVLGMAVGHMLYNKRCRNVCVTAPKKENLGEFFRFLRSTLEALGAKKLESRVKYLDPVSVPSTRCDLLVVDEAAGIPVPLLLKYVGHRRVIYSTTTHGYEGTGRAFTVRFLGALKRQKIHVRMLEMHEPIRYAAGDPVEHWLFSTLLLDSEPATIEGVDVSKLKYKRYKIEELLKNEQKLREYYGIFVLAHYRNNPNDFGILCDAPNHEIRVLEYKGHIVCSVQLAREGALGEFAEDMYYGYIPPGNIVPDVIIKHYRNREFAKKQGYRIVRIATHPDFMNMGIGTRMLEYIKNEEADWVGSSFGATPQLLRFWTRGGFLPVHISPRMNEKTGEYSVVVLRTPDSYAEELSRKFAERFVLLLGDLHREMDVHMARAILAAIPGSGKINLSDEDWKRIIAYAWGPANYEVTADVLWKLAKQYFMAKKKPRLSAEQERILIAKVLQHRTWHEAGRAVGRGDMYVVIELRETVRKFIGGEYNDEVSEFQRRFHGEDS